MVEAKRSIFEVLSFKTVEAESQALFLTSEKSAPVIAVNSYFNAGNLLKYIDEWHCTDEDVSNCTIRLARYVSVAGFWSEDDMKLIESWIEDLKSIGYHFPLLSYAAEYRLPEQPSRGENCRRANVEFPANQDIEEIAENSREKVRVIRQLAHLCTGTLSTRLHTLPTPKQINDSHGNNDVLANLRNTVLVITNNYRLNETIGILQRLYQPYFAVTVFCGPWFPDQYSDNVLPKILHPFNYIHLSDAEMMLGYYAYYCLSKVRDLRLQNIKGYFVIADDNVFNFWHPLDLSKTIHATGDTKGLNVGDWWNMPVGLEAAKRAVRLFENVYVNDEEVQAVYSEFQQRLASRARKTVYASEMLTRTDGHTVSDFYYVPAGLLNYYAGLMEVFFEAQLFHEIAINKYLHTVEHIRLNTSQRVILWLSDREHWDEKYNESLITLHPIKFSHLRNETFRHRFCSTVLTAFWSNLIDVGRTKVDASVLPK